MLFSLKMEKDNLVAFAGARQGFNFAKVVYIDRKDDLGPVNLKRCVCILIIFLLEYKRQKIKLKDVACYLFRYFLKVSLMQILQHVTKVCPLPEK
jgi:hypothetical protein